MSFIARFLPELVFSVGEQRHNHSSSSITGLADGGVAVTWLDAWTSLGSVRRFRDVDAGVFDAAGHQIAARQIAAGNHYVTPPAQGFIPSAATLSSGDWAVAWVTTGGEIGWVTAPWAQVFTPLAEPAGAPIAITPPGQFIPGIPFLSGLAHSDLISIASLPGNSFVAHWAQRVDQSTPFYDIRGQVFSSAGEPLSAVFTVDGRVIPTTLQATTMANSDVLSVWSFQDGPLTQIRGRIFDEAGQPLGAELPLATAMDGANVASATFVDGRFVVVWDTATASGRDIRGQIFTASGIAAGPELQINATPEGNQVDPDVAVLPDGSFVVTWTDDSGATGDPNTGINVRLFGADGTALSAELLVNTSLGPAQSQSDIAVLPDGALAVSWTSLGSEFSEIHGQYLRLLAEPPLPAPRSDIDRDGRSDVIWSHNAGLAAVWEMSGTAIKFSSSLGPTMPGYTVAAAADFDGNGLGDIAWRSADGYIVIWEMNGTTIQRALGVGQMSGDWALSGTGDFTGDGHADLLWRHDGGYVALWEIKDSTLTRLSGVGVMGNEWQIAGTGDFNSDGHADVLWHHSAGQVALWEMEGSIVGRELGVGTMDAGWHVGGVADVNGDGTSDIIWRHHSGPVALWEMQNSVLVRAAGVGSMSDGWEVAGVGDFAGDGDADILWRDTGGYVAMWEMDDGVINVAAGLATMSQEWNAIL